MGKKTQELLVRQNDLVKLIADTDIIIGKVMAEKLELRLFVRRFPLVINNKTIADNIKKLQELEVKILSFSDALKKEQDVNIHKHTELKDVADRIRINIDTEYKASRAETILLVKSIEGIRDGYINMTGDFDALIAKLAMSISGSRSTLEKFTTDVSTATEEIGIAMVAEKDKAVVQELADMESVSIYLPITASRRPPAGKRASRQPV